MTHFCSLQLEKFIDAQITLEGSKSLTARALIICFLNTKKIKDTNSSVSIINNASPSDDSRSLISALNKLGTVCVSHGNSIEVLVPSNNLASNKFDIEIDIGPAGTSMRFLTALLAALPNCNSRIFGSKRMHERPIGDLVNALKQLGAEIDYLENINCPPLSISGKKLTYTDVLLNASVSSQFLSALLLTAPLYEKGLKIQLTGTPVSASYVDMTLAIMKQAGVCVYSQGHTYEILPSSKYYFDELNIESDASGASYFLAIAAISGGSIKIDNFPINSLQGDSKFPNLLERMGCYVTYTDSSIKLTGTKELMPINVDMTLMPDTAQTLAIVAALAKGKSVISGLATLRNKETDRIKAMQNELKKVGIKTEATEDSLTIYGGTPNNARIETYEDHRMAMSFAALAPVCPGIEIENPSVVTKSFPGFWNKLDELGINCRFF